jgi:hypothetical protein
MTDTDTDTATGTALPPDPDGDNPRRAQVAAAAADAYCNLTRRQPLHDSDPAEALSDLLGDLHHLVDRLRAQGLLDETFEDLLDRGLNHYDAETAAG